MNAVIITLLVLSVIPITLSWVSGYFRHSQFGAVDNKAPRQQNQLLIGAGARAVAAQKNAWEALLLFVAALLALNYATVPVEQYVNLCWVVLVARLLHAVFYLVNQDILRSISFLVSYGVCVYFFILSL